MSLLGLAAASALAAGYFSKSAPEKPNGKNANKNPPGEPKDFDPYLIGLPVGYVKDFTQNHALYHKRFRSKIYKAPRDIERRVGFHRQVGPNAAAWLQHTLADLMNKDPPFYGNGVGIARNRQMIAARMPYMDPGTVIVDRELKEWNNKPAPYIG